MGNENSSNQSFINQFISEKTKINEKLLKEIFENYCESTNPKEGNKYSLQQKETKKFVEEFFRIYKAEKTGYGYDLNSNSKIDYPLFISNKIHSNTTEIDFPAFKQVFLMTIITPNFYFKKIKLSSQLKVKKKKNFENKNKNETKYEYKFSFNF